MTKSTSSSEPTTTTVSMPKGRNVSGRSWKKTTQKRASSLRKTKVNNQTTTWEQKVMDKRAKQEIQELQKQLQEERREAKIQKKERRLENERRRAENELQHIQKSIQTLNHKTVGTKLKAMSKKQLRQVKKSRINTKTGVVEYVSAYAK